ncbi:MAG TPA: Crp/Fnr family transcriptional regulator [Pyrinomonadaceae bacterium]|nr:Crp/Fnr family transcriptional regulator [Pyrinomonadaceae bacterium]
MPSAQYIELDQPPEVSNGGNLHSLLREIHASNIRYLNSVHGRGKVLFAEGEPARGVYILRTGSATVSISSIDGRIVTPRVARAGDVLGLNSVLASSSYEATVKTLEPCRTDFIPRAELVELIEKSHAGARAILKILSHELTELTERTRSLLLPQTASARLARLLLEWSKKSDRIDRVFTHEEIAQMICSSRETVTRTLASLGRRKIIEITSDSILIRDNAALSRMAQG